MGRLIKYLVIVYLTFSILAILGFTFNALYNNYVNNYVPETTYNAQGYPLLQPIPTNSPFFYLSRGIMYLTFFGFPILVVFMSALYLFKEKKGYFKSLIIPASFAILGAAASFIWLTNYASGEEGMAILYILPMLLATLVLSLIINAIILAIVKKE